MRYIKLIFVVLYFVLCSKGIAQRPFILTDGVIEYEKTVNKYAALTKIIKTYTANPVWEVEFNRYKSEHPQFLKLSSTLTFSTTATLFTPLKFNGDLNENLWNNKLISDQKNTVYNNFSNNSSIMKTTVLGEDFLVKDSLRRIKWKITDETREIAGFQCRRANGLLLDSIYVVAFFTNEIPVASGPESFTGLPGMILGLALPYENVTWFAVKVTPTEKKNISEPKGGKPTSFAQLFTLWKKLGYSPETIQLECKKFLF